MRAREMMTKHVVTVPTGTPADEAWQLMRGQHIHHLLVGSVTNPLGLVSERDLGGRAGAAIRRGKSVDELMATNLVTIDGDATARQVANTMRGRSIGCVLVTERRRVTGILTVSDLLELIGRGSEHPVQRVERHGLHHRVPHRKVARPTGVW